MSNKLFTPADVRQGMLCMYFPLVRKAYTIAFDLPVEGYWLQRVGGGEIPIREELHRDGLIQRRKLSRQVLCMAMGVYILYIR